MEFWWRELREREDLENLGVSGRIDLAEGMES
jgi:hypothetical protein